MVCEAQLLLDLFLGLGVALAHGVLLVGLVPLGVAANGSQPVTVSVKWVLTRGCSSDRSAHGSPSSTSGRWHARACSTTAACSYLLNYNSLGGIEVPRHSLFLILVFSHLVHEALPNDLVRVARQVASLKSDRGKGNSVRTLVHVFSLVDNIVVIFAANFLILESFGLAQVLSDPRGRLVLNELVNN